MKKILITGSGGLIGSEVCLFFAEKGYQIFGLDNNQRAVFFGKEDNITSTVKFLREKIKKYTHYNTDIRDRKKNLSLIKTIRPHTVVHCAAQPSHDLAAQITLDDFDVNAGCTLNLLEAARQFCPESPFVHLSTNKVYGDKPNFIKMRELKTRWDYDDSKYKNGIPETFSIDQCTHSLFGVSKVAGDIFVQEYGRYFNMPTCVLRGGCLTVPLHKGVELHGFLSYLVKCNILKRPYNIFGYKGKQVRDNIHSYDVANFIYRFVNVPRVAEVYNIGGGKESSCSITKEIKTIEGHTNIKHIFTYN